MEGLRADRSGDERRIQPPTRREQWAEAETVLSPSRSRVAHRQTKPLQRACTRAVAALLRTVTDLYIPERNERDVGAGGLRRPMNRFRKSGSVVVGTSRIAAMTRPRFACWRARH